jgi:small subunit ribosomal protein S17e
LDRIKRLSYEVLVDHKSKFGEDFANNKKALDQISIIRSKGLKNEIAGYITKFIKKEIREEKFKQSRIESSRIEEQRNEENQVETPETVTEATPETVTEATPETVTEATPETVTEATPETVTEATPEEEKAE